MLQLYSIAGARLWKGLGSEKYGKTAARELCQRGKKASGYQVLLARAPLRLLHARLPELAGLPLGLGDNECPAATRFGGIQFLVYHEDSLSHETPVFIHRRLGVDCTRAGAAAVHAYQCDQAGLSAITGLAFTRDVPYALITKNQLHKYLEQRLRDTMKPADVRAEELTLKMLGLVPQDFDLRQNTLELLTEQAAAFYDYNQKRLFVLEGAGAGEDERVALIHELAHALADQHFHLAKFIHEGMKSDDDSTARQAVMEGQATWLMAAYLAREAADRPNFRQG